MKNTTPLLSVSGTNEFNILEDQVWTGDFFVTDPDRQNIFWFLQNNPANGTVIFEPENGENVSVSYTPDGNYSGSDSFTVGVTDGIASANASFEILIEEVSDIPIFELFPSFEDLTDDDNLSKIIKVTDGDGFEGLSISYQGKPEWMLIDHSQIDQNGTISISGSLTLTIME